MGYKMGIFGIMAALLPSLASAAEHRTIDGLENAYSVESCVKCHGKVHEEWRSSYHSQSVVHSLGGIRNYLVVGLGQEWKKPVNKENLMRCMGCHAPQLQDASESLIAEIAGLIVSAVDDKSDAKKAAARKELEKFSVNCIVCHNLKVAVDRNLRGKPKPGTMYGPSGATVPSHPTERTPAISTAMFCGQCHGIHTAPDGDDIVCNTLYGSYIDGFRANGGSETCQDCHMKKKDRGHRFPGAYEADIVRDGIGVEVQATGIKLTPGVWTPTAVVTVDLINRAGHRVPDG